MAPCGALACADAKVRAWRDSLCSADEQHTKSSGSSTSSNNSSSKSVCTLQLCRDYCAGVDLTMHPRCARGSFPGLSRTHRVYTPLQLLRLLPRDTNDEDGDAVKGSNTTTAATGAAMARRRTAGLLAAAGLLVAADVACVVVLAALAQRRGRRRALLLLLLRLLGSVSTALLSWAVCSAWHRRTQAAQPPSLLCRCVLHASEHASNRQDNNSRCSCCCCCCTPAARTATAAWLQTRCLSCTVNCSSSTAGPCRVTDRVVLVTNSHAGTHADSPAHFCHDSHVGEYSNAHYTGDVTVLDLRRELDDNGGDGDGAASSRAIGVALLQRALQRLPHDVRSGARPLHRLLLITHSHGSDTDGEGGDVWRDNFAYCTRDAVHYLCARFPQLLLLAVDTPSVDAATASPIVDHVHGALLSNGVAVLENVRTDGLWPLLLRQQQQQQQQQEGTEAQRCGEGVLEGVLVTTFAPLQCFDDSRGCSVLFFPQHTAAAASA